MAKRFKSLGLAWPDVWIWRISMPCSFSQLLERAAGVFGAAAEPVQPGVDLKALHAKIGQLTLENDFLEGALTKAGLLSAKR